MKKVSCRFFTKIWRTKGRVGENEFCLLHERLSVSNAQWIIRTVVQEKGREGDLGVLKYIEQKRTNDRMVAGDSVS